MFRTRPSHRLLGAAACALLGASSASGAEQPGIDVFDTAGPLAFKVATNRALYTTLSAQAVLIDPFAKSALGASTIKTEVRALSGGSFTVTLPVEALAKLPPGHYMVVLDLQAAKKGAGPGERAPTAQINAYYQTNKTGVSRISLQQFVAHTQGSNGLTYAALGSYFHQVVPVGQGNASSSSDESDCCTDPDPDLPDAPDVDVDGPGETSDGGGAGSSGSSGAGSGGAGSGGAGSGGAGSGGAGTGGTGGTWNPEDDPLFPIWDCWENGNCDDEVQPGDTGHDGDSGGDTGPLNPPTTDSGPAL